MMLRLAVLVVGVALPMAAATHDIDCTPTQADPSTVQHVRSPDGRLFYLEERGTPLPYPVPLSGFLLGEGTAVYEETFAVVGLQRGGCSPGYLPGPPRAQDDCLTSGRDLCPTRDTPVPCIVWDWDPIMDENCGHGSD